MKTLLTLTITTFILITNLNCQSADVRKSMVHFDQAFLPVMMHVYQGNMYQAKKSVFYLDFKWQKLRNQYEFARVESAWRNAFVQIDEYLGNAYMAIDGNNAKLALAQLQQVKDEFVALRERYRIEYYLDYLYDFQATASTLTETSADEMLCLMEWEDLEQMSLETNQAWQDVRFQPVDVEFYELDIEKMTLLKAKMQVMTTLIKNLNKAIESANRAEVAKACAKIQPALVEVLWVFGNIDASATYYADNNSESIGNPIIR
ncbi:MAG: hypothetical protein SFU99_07905 [Saprospiraceae bacterium]|nr:hypothetical protein [Saprospiraceae bacterium]